MTLGSDGKISSYFNLTYSDVEIGNEAAGACDFVQETLTLSCKMDVNGESEQEKSTYLLGFSGKVNEGYNETSGSWYIIPADYNASWMKQDNGTFSLKKYST